MKRSWRAPGRSGRGLPDDPEQAVLVDPDDGADRNALGGFEAGESPFEVGGVETLLREQSPMQSGAQFDVELYVQLQLALLQLLQLVLQPGEICLLVIAGGQLDAADRRRFDEVSQTATILKLDAERNPSTLSRLPLFG